MKSRGEFQLALDNCGADLLKLKRLSEQLQNADGGWRGPARLLVINTMRLARTSLPVSDGRPLYAYRLQLEQFDHWQQTLKNQVATGRMPHAGAFVLWAAEWFRRCYRGDIVKWEALGGPLGLSLQQHQWRNLADSGLRYWGLRSVQINGSNYRLVAIARQAGFPVAALADGQGGWAESYLSGLVGQLLGAAVIREDTAIRIAENLSDRVPDTWRNPQMQAICAELANIIVSLRQEADAGGVGSSALVSSWLTQNRPDWRDELPLRMEGQASALIDSLLTAKAIPNGGGTVRVRRFVDVSAETVREGVALDLTGALKLNAEQQAALDRDGGIVRLRMFAAGDLAQSITGELAMADAPERQADGWRTRLTNRIAEHSFPFEKSASVELRADGQRVGAPFELRGGEPVKDSLRIYELDQNTGDGEGRLWLRSWSSGAFKAETLIVELPSGWAHVPDTSSSEDGNNVWLTAAKSTFWKVSCAFMAESPQGDRYLVRPGQNVAQRDALHLVGSHIERVQHGDGTAVIAGKPTVQLTQSNHLRAIGTEKIGWRRVGDRDWQSMLLPAPFGLVEFGWRDATTGYLRAKSKALLVPEHFAVGMQKNGDNLTVELTGWEGAASLSQAAGCGPNKWRVNLAHIERDRLDLKLVGDAIEDIHLEIPLPIISWIANWDGTLLRRDSVISLATLNRYVARNERFDLMGEVVSGQAKSNLRTGRIWRGSSDMGLSSIRDDIANMIRPLGIDAKVQLDFNDSYSNHWYVKEFETEVEWREGRGWFPLSTCDVDSLAVRGRRMADATREETFGHYNLTDAVHSAPLPIPRLNEPWLVYLAAEDRILSRPRVIGSPALNPQAHTRLGKAMSLPFAETEAALDAFVCAILDNPSTTQAWDDIRSIIVLSHSLGGLPPRTFHVFDALNERPELGPHLLMHSGEQELTSVAALSKGLLFDWTIVPIEVWQNAHDAAGAYYMDNLPEVAGQTPGDRGTMVVSLLQQQRSAIVSALPWLAGVFGQNKDGSDYGAVCESLFNRSGDRIDKSKYNPFRPDLDAHSPDRRLSSGLARVCDAPMAAVLAATGKLELRQAQIMAVKDVQEHHPQFFSEAYGFALGDIV